MTTKQEQQELEERRIRARGLMTNEEELEMERRAGTGRRASSYYAPPPPRQPLTLGSALYTGLYLLVMAFFPVTFPLMLAYHMVGFLRDQNTMGREKAEAWKRREQARMKP
jgi:hypothetical protein